MPRAATNTILIADNHPLTRLAIRALMTRHGHTVVGETDSDAETLRLACATAPNMIILDLVPPSAILSTLNLLSCLPTPIPVLIFSEWANDHYALRCLELGAVGFVSKKAQLCELISAVNVVLTGYIYVPERLLKKLQPSTGLASSPSLQKTTLNCAI